MENMTIQRAAALCGGSIFNNCTDDVTLGKIVIDSRQVVKGDLFAAFRGERVDGHDYIPAAFDRGAACCLAEHVPAGETRPVILVADVMQAMEDIAAGYRQDFDLPIIGITGSVGKTSAKEMISAVLEQRRFLLKTEGNLNNRYGVPMMLSRMSSSHQAAVIEMGISEFGEMTHLARMVLPTVAVFTTIGHAHLEFLHDLNGVLKAKSEMLDFLPITAPVIVNGDDPMLAAMTCEQHKITYGFQTECDVRAENVKANQKSLTCEIVSGLRRIPVCIPAVGKHYVYAALAAATVGMLFEMNNEEICRGIASFKNVERRGELVQNDYLTLIDDSYNANPDSVRSGIDSLMLIQAPRHICILGDMLELGENAPQMHYEIGQYAVKQGIDLVLTCGNLSLHTSRGAGDRGIHYETKSELISALHEQIKPGDSILVKASKGSHFEVISAELKSFAYKNEN